MKTALIYKNLSEFDTELKLLQKNNIPIVITSGFMAPIHSGHTRCILESSDQAMKINGKLVVLVNGDGALMRKKGFIFMNEIERAEIVASLKGVDYVIIYDDGTQFVSNAIEYIKPVKFCKGGDRGPGNIPEQEICNKIGCKIVFDVGLGGKIQSSTNLIEDIKLHESK